MYKLVGISFAIKGHKTIKAESLGTKIKHKFDLREDITPFTFLKITQAFREMKEGEIIQVNGNDAKTRKEILKVLNTFHYTIVDTEENGNFYCICLKKES